MEKLYLPHEEYEAAVEEYRSRSGYDDMTDEEKELFDEKLDRAVGVRETDETEAADAPERTDDAERLRGEMKQKYGYDDMSEAEKESFDQKFNEVFGTEVEDADDSDDIPQKVLTKRR